MKTLSVIIPMYNVEPFVERCIRSLEDQDIPVDDYEIICVNDGSPDNCREIVIGLQREFQNIILVDQINMGVSEARNTGIRNAGGKYLLMIDPDDYVKKDSFGAFLERAERLSLDLLYLGFEIYDVIGDSIWKTDFSESEDKIYCGVDGYFAERKKVSRDSDRSWAILFRHELLTKNRLRYPKDVPYLEDGLFMVKISGVASRVSYYDQHVYQRTTRLGSATNSNLFSSQRAINGFLNAVNDLRQFSSQGKFDMKQAGLINHGIANFVLLSLFPLSRMKFLTRFKRTISKLRMAGYARLETFGVVEPYLSYAKLYNASPYLLAIVYWKDLLFKKVQIMHCKILGGSQTS
jgi:glycosyltransferase involved in cell wall biosynthesis